MGLVCQVEPTRAVLGKKVICYSEAWGQGGIETFLMNLFRRLQGRGFAFDVFSTWDWNDKLDSELSELGVGRWTSFTGHKPGQAERLIKGSAAYGELIDMVGCDVAYVNTMNGMGFLWSDVAKHRGVPVRVVHSHNSAFGLGKAAMKALAHGFGKNVLGGSATTRLAVSKDAGVYLFGSRPFEIVNNGIDTKRFTYDPAARAELRSALGIPEDALLFGSIGRIAEAKNPLFQIRVFSEILKAEPSARYLMVGEGDMRPQVEALVSELGLRDAVFMPGYLPDPTAAYSALDCFLMPSLYEGLAIVRIESQCAGCPILCSDALPPEAHVTDTEELISLSAGEAAWAKRALIMANEPRDRVSYAAQIVTAGFDADATAQHMAKILGGDA
jgi:glycosyltransferase involved in cell wall biosynthesis